MSDIQLLNESIAWAAAKQPVITIRFYEILFERYPAVKPLFGRRSTDAQAGMLQGALLAVLEHIEDAEWLSDTLGALGATHVGYGVQDDMYPAVGECLVATLAEHCGDRWTQAHADAWVRAYGVLAGLAIAGAQRARARA